MPERVQLSRRKGATLPAGAVVVTRATRWGNPHRLGNNPDAADRLGVVLAFAVDLLGGKLAFTVDDVRRKLGGRDLACWCPLTDENGDPVPCHADVLLRVANGDDPSLVQLLEVVA